MKSANQLVAVVIRAGLLAAGCAGGPQISIFHEERLQ